MQLREIVRGMFVVTLMAGTAGVAAGDAAAQSQRDREVAAYPARPIRFILGFTPGGGTDTVARLIGQKLNEVWGKPVVVDNRPGGGGIVAIDTVARATPDGYTILLVSVSFVIQPGLSKKPSYDPVGDFAAVSLASSAPYIVVVHPAVPANSIKELIALAKAKPGQLNYASSGAGSGPHLAPELFKSMAGVDIVHVPYKGATGITDLIAGAVQMAFAGGPQTLPHVKSGRLRALAVTGARRFSIVPDLPTVAEAGVPGYEVEIWYGVLAPAGTPSTIVRRLSAEIAKLLVTDEIKERFAGQGLEPRGGTPQQFGEYIKREIPKWASVAKAAGLQPE